MLTDNFETHANRFLEPSLQPKDRLALAQEIRESIEIVQTSEYGNFLQHFVKAFDVYLRGTSSETSPFFVRPEERFNTESPSYRTRQVLLEILNRVPTTEVLRPFAPDLLKLCMHLLHSDDEDNAVIALRIILDLHKTYRAQRPQPGPLEPDVQPFLDFVKQVYENFPNTLNDAFRPPVAGAPAKPAVRRSKESFKVVTECPLIVMFLFQLYDSHAPANVKTLLPLMVKAINLRAPADAQRRSPQHASLFVDFIAAQVKTLSFLTYLLRGSADWVRPHKDTIPLSVVQLLVSCPHDTILVRKELLVATRHILATDFREGFFKHVDIFLDEKLLVGTSRGAGDSLRPLAYSLLAEVVHHVRLTLSMAQLSKAVHLFSRNVHDASLPLTVQTTSIRLLMNLVEGIYHKHNSDQDKLGAQPPPAQGAPPPVATAESSVKGRKLLVRILDTFVRKFGTLKEYTKKLCEAKGEAKLDDPTVQLEFMPFRSGSLSDITVDVAKETNDCKQLIKTLIVAVRTVVWSVSNVKNQSVARGMQEHECLITAKLLKHGLRCFGIYSNDDAAGAKEEKEILELFAGVFTVLDERTFRDVFTLNMQTLFEHIVGKETCLSIPQHFLSNQSVTRIFTEILLQFLVARIKDLSTGTRQESATLLNLFKIVFMGVSTFPENETVLRPHIRSVVGTCLRHAMQEKRPVHYYMLLKTLFRSVTTGKFELLTKEFISLLKSLLDSLCKLLQASQEEDTKELLVELCLTVPSRLSFLFPFIPLLMKPLVQALNSSPELVHLGLKKLEAWVDSLQPAYLDPLLQAVKDDLMAALYKQLQSGNNTFAVAAIKILGKLGGRNRRLLRDQAVLEGKEHGEDGVKIAVQLPRNAGGFVQLDLSLDDAVKTALGLLEKPGVDIYYKRQSLELIKACVGCVLPPLKPPPPVEMAAPPSLAEELEGAEKVLLVGVLPEISPAKVAARTAICKKVLWAVFFLSAQKEFEEEMQPYLHGVCRYFAASVVLCSSHEDPNVYEESTFLDVAIELLCKDQKARGDRKPGAPSDTVQPLEIFIDFLLQLCSPAEAAELPIFERIARMLCNMCYQRPWWQKVAGCVGIQILAARMPAPPLLRMELATVRALCAIWKESSADEIAITADRSYTTLAFLLRRAHGPPAEGGAAREGAATQELEKSSFRDVLNFLGLELCAPNLAVRSNTQKVLGEISEFTSTPVATLLEPFKANMSQQMFKRRLTAFPVAVQIGHIDALTYCLSLQPPFLVNDPGLTQLLQDALGIAEMEDQQVMRHQNDGAAVTQLTTLRTHCVQLLRTAMASNEVNLATNSPDLRNNIILMFFKVITKGFPDAVVAAREGLAEVLQTQRGKAPFKDLLQSSLRPVLVNLADYRKLNVPLLEGLSRLLELLSSWFNVTLGEKLLDYLQKWAEADKVQPAGTPKPTKSGDEPKIPAAIIELFHLLPPAPEKFLEKLARLTIELEGKLPMTGDYSSVRSPYRAPFTKFLNRFPSEGLDFFYERMLDPQLCKLFHHVLRSEMAWPLRDEVKRSEEKLLKATLLSDPANPNHNELRFQGIAIIRTICKYFPEWLRERPTVREQLIKIWTSQERTKRLQNEEGLEFEHLLESKMLVKCLLGYARSAPQDHTVLFDMLTIFTTRSVVDYSFVKHFYAHEVATGYSLKHRKHIIVEFLNSCKDPAVPQEMKVQALQLVVIPTLTAAFNREGQEQIIEEKTINLIVKDLLDPGDEVLRGYDEALHIELLQLATLLIRYLKDQLISHRKELIKFAWDRLKREESTSKHWAYVNVCRFIEAYDAPHKIILQVYVALLRAFQPENRPLLKQALDILTPALPKRLPPAEHKYPIWIRYTKKIIVEEGHSLPHLIHIWHFLVRHSDLFYSSRAQFVPQMVNSLNRIGMANSCPVENRKLAIDLADLVISWDHKRIEESAAVKTEDKMDVDGAADSKKRAEPDAGAESKEDGGAAKKIKTETGAVATSAAPTPTPPAAGAGAPVAGQPAAAAAAPAQPADDDYKPNGTMIEMVVNFLMRVALITAEPKDTTALSERCVKLLDKALQIWSSAVLKFQYFEKVIEKSENHPANLATGLEIFNVLLDRGMTKSITQNQNAVKLLLQSCMPCDNAKVMDALCRLVTKHLALPPPNAAAPPAAPAAATPAPPTPTPDVKAPDPNAAFVAFLRELIEKGLSVVGLQQTQPTGRTERAQIHNAERILRIIAASKPEAVDGYAGNLVKVVQKFTREHFQQMQQSRQRPTEQVPEDVVEGTAKVLVIGMQLLSPRLGALGEARKGFLIAVSTLIERSMQIERQNDSQVLSEVANIVGQWVSDPDSGMKTQEKANFVHKMMQFEQLRNSGPYTTFLQMVYDLVSSAAPQEPDLVSKVQRAWMIGLRCRDPKMRKSFFTFFEGQVPQGLFHRIVHIIQKQEWDSIGDSYWLKHGVELVLCTANNEQRVQERASSNAADVKTHKPATAPAVLEALAENDKFLNDSYQVTTSAVLGPLCELLHQSNALTHAIWIQLFPVAWESLTADEQQQLTKPLGMLVARDCNKFQDLRRPNVVQGLLEAMHRCKPTPHIAPPILRFAGRTFNAWHSALSLLEDEITAMQYATNSDGIKTDPEEVMDALTDLYRRLGEQDVMCGLCCRQSGAVETKVAISYLQFGYWQKAQDIFVNAMSKSQQPGGVPNSTKAEKTVWEEQWVTCARQLNQWDIISQFAREVTQFDLMLESCWKTDDWGGLRDTLQDPMPSDQSQTKIFDIFNALQEWRLPDAEKHCQEAFQYALKSWCLLPEVTVQAYVPLMQTFHRLVELQESTHMLEEVNKSVRHNSVPELKSTIQAWRERLPNKWDETSVWYDLLTWRNHVFKMLTETTQNSQDIKQALMVCGQHEEAWTLIKFSESARKHGLPHLCIQNLQKIMSFQSMDVQHAYTKTREEVLSRLEIGTTQELNLGMNAINKINLDYFNPTQKAEILRLKGEFLQRIPDPRNVGQMRTDEAHQAYSTALATAESHGKAWVSWGKLWDTLLQEKMNRGGVGDDKVRGNYAEYTLNCYLQGVRYGCDRARMLLSKVLWIIDMFDDNAAVGAEFDKNVELVPSWNWIFWVPLLLGALARPQAHRFRKVLTKLAADYPQSLYCPLRRFLIEKQGQSRAAEGGDGVAAQAAEAGAGGTTGSTPTPAGASPAAPAQVAAPPPQDSPAAAAPPPAASPAGGVDTAKAADMSQAASDAKAAMVVRQHAQEIMKHLRDTHLPFFLETERFVVEITRSFKPTHEQQLQHLLVSHIDALSARDLGGGVAAGDAERVEGSLVDLFTGLEQQLEQENAKAKDPAAGANNAQLIKEIAAQQAFLADYKPLIAKDFFKQADGTYPSQTFKELFLRLRKWQGAVRRVLARPAFPRQLEALSRTLAESKGSQMEVPGQYLAVKEPMPDQHVKVDRVLPDVEVVERNGACHRRITIRGNDGKHYTFLVEATGSTIHTGDERTLQLCQLMNRCMDKEKQARRRHMSLHVRPIVGLAPRCRLIADDPKSISLHEVLSDFLAGKGHTPDSIAIKFQEKASLLARSTTDPLMAAMNEIADLIPDTVLLDHIRGEVPTNDKLWSFRKHFAVQYACSILAAHALLAPPPSPSRLLLSQRQGDLVLVGATSGVGVEGGGLNMPSLVPFRMTRMLTTLISPIGLEGGFSSAIGAAAMALSHPHRQLRHHLYVLLREHLHSLPNAKPIPQTPQAQQEHNRAVSARAGVCAGEVLERVSSLSPTTAAEEAAGAGRGGDELPPPLNHRVIELIRAAADPHKQMQMPPLWHPWA